MSRKILDEVPSGGYTFPFLLFTPRTPKGRTAMTAPRESRARIDEDASKSLEQDPILIVADGFLCQLKVWTDAEWSRLPESERPIKVRRFEGLGWVGAVPEIALN
jgi:hypothetical protein